MLNSDINEVFSSMHQSIMTKIKNYAIKNEIVLDRIILSYRVNLYFLEKAIIVRLIQVNANNIVFTLKIRLAILIFHAIFFFLSL